MKKEIYIKVWLLPFMALLLCGCMDEDLVNDRETVDHGDEVEVTVQFAVPHFTTITTRAMTEQESRVDVVDVLVYQVNELGEERFVYHRGMMTNSLEMSGSSGSFKVRLAKSKSGEKYTFDFCFNLKSLLSLPLYGTNPAIIPGLTRQEIQQAFNTTSSIVSSGSLPMWAGTSEGIEITAATSFPGLKVFHSVARVDVGVNLDQHDVPQGLSNFTLNYVYAAYPPARSLYIPDMTNLNPAGDKFLAPSLFSPYSMSTSTSNIGKSVTGNAVIAGFYIFEPDVNRMSSNNCFAIVIRGNYTAINADGSTTTTQYYYPIRFRDPEDPGKRLDIIRNNLYRINILSINGPGYITIPNAVQGKEINITYDLHVEEGGAINHVVYNNQNYLGVSSVYQEHTGTDTGGQIKVRTDVTGGWQVTVAGENGNSVSSWFTSSTSSTTSSIAVGSVTYTLQPNYSHPRAAVLTFTPVRLGALSIQTLVLQNGAWSIYSDYQPGTLMNGEGDEYKVYVYGNVPPNLKVRAYAPERGLTISYNTLTYPGGIVAQGSPQTQELEIMGNAWIPMKIRDVEFQYSTDNGVTWVTFEEGPQGKGHFRLPTTGRIVALYNMEDDNGNTINNISWAEAMGLDSESDVESYVGSYAGGYDSNHGNGHNAHGFGYNYDPAYPASGSNYQVYHNYDDVATRKTGGYLPTPAVTGSPGTGYPINGNLFPEKYPAGVTERDGKTGCAIYNEDKYGFAGKYPKGRWRLPSIRELEEMAKYEDHIGDLPLTGKDDNYWSSTEYRNMNLRMQAMYYHFRDGAVIVDPNTASENSNYKALRNSDKKLYVRCVFVPDGWVAPASLERALEYFNAD